MIFVTLSQRSSCLFLWNENDIFDNNALGGILFYKPILLLFSVNHILSISAKACGKTMQFQYKKVVDGSVIVNGIPPQLLPLKTMSNYGVQKLLEFVKIEEITV